MALESQGQGEREGPFFLHSSHHRERRASAHIEGCIHLVIDHPQCKAQEDLGGKPRHVLSLVAGVTPSLTKVSGEPVVVALWWVGLIWADVAGRGLDKWSHDSCSRRVPFPARYLENN